MKKLYLVFLVLVLLFIPTTNAVAVYQLDQPVRELNNHTLREVFDGGSNNISLESQTYRIYLNPTNVNIGDTYYTYGDIVLNIGSSASVAQLTSGLEVIFQLPNLLSSVNVFYNSIETNKIRVFTEINSDFDIDISFINMTVLGIFNLTVEEMDKYYDLYLEAVRFENENIEASQDPGGYQNIFKSVINGVKGLIVEMGNVWQFLNAPIITSDMSDYSFSIDWSWDLIGVVRQLINSLAILILQTNFIFINLLFSFTGIPVQISILSMIFSNFVFVILGWIIVKSFII